MFSSLPLPTIFAHRGASAHAPENTLASFTLAVTQGADAIELDAKLSADDQIIVIHDQTVDRTTDGTGKVRDLTLAEIKKLDAGSHFDIAFHGEPVPTLEDVFVAVGQKIFINIELTNYTSVTDDLPLKVTALIKRFELEQRVMFSSFNPIALMRARRELPTVPVGLLALPGRSGWLARSWFGQLLPQDALHPELGDITPALLERVHRSGKRIHVYTVNHPDEMRHLFNLGVDGIFTDDPLLARQILTKNEGQQTAAAR